ncbi:oxygen-dependent coproporphyrinogen oxidase [Rhodobaculum claviforme]|uniref:coproporphyrinogen oxidase n=1 Tax=Rhodobaculum claviforme TaxID=1549854 RepID=A0A934TJF9_9RHOB|nr:oxygen-dependent coproporphyrinogen oxidase [Rhodobaculum claviforme]MBK5926738.1 coproporphyrinogen III oxidase [Rhodobaculum claviforme]
MTEMFEQRKARAADWFRELRDSICTAFEAMEDAHTDGPGAELPAGRFALRETQRTASDGGDAGGGLMSVMRGGRVFEKVGVNVSAVFGTLEPRARRSLTARKEIPGLEEDPRFWASGVSLVAHMRNPHVPAVHLNTRMFWTPGAWWFGGGTDLNPALERDEDTADFHAVLRDACAAHGADLYPRYKAWADEYFFVPHRKRARGVGGIFYDDHNTGDWEADFAFTQAVGRAFLPAFLPLVERRRQTPWTDADRDAQLVHRGLYAEYNLVYDRGTKFGLETGHDPDAVLMSLPPLAKWI